ncbi:Beta-amylase [Thalictrum thalictroides]|uniref:Beta-amylase n=1 Tax=Thalictrum thalictroides TaxID=46969 RepID=A0A7J6X851_THATH|nr:Beta-amylase [Thalictrum thalictroides]
MLMYQGERILSNAQSIFHSTGVKISVKVAGIHWHYGTRSHARELTVGYYNTHYHDGYIPIAHMLARYGAIFNFTCIEMRDHEQPQDALCAPEKLVRQVAMATHKIGVPLAGENALPRYDETAHDQILNVASLKLDEIEQESDMCSFTFWHMNPDLFQADNWRKFVSFVKKMKERKTTSAGNNLNERMSSQQTFTAGQTQGHAEAKADEWIESTKGTAQSALDKTVDAAHSTKESAQQGQEQASGFIHQTSEQVMNMAHDAIENAKSTLGVGEHSHKK